MTFSIIEMALEGKHHLKNYLTTSQILHRIKDKLSNMFRLADLYFEDRDIDKEFRKIFLQSFHPIKKRKITQKIEGMVSSKANLDNILTNDDSMVR